MNKSQGTLAVQGGEQKAKPYHSLTTPLVLSSTFPFDNTEDLLAYKAARDSSDDLDRQEYARYGSPTVRAVEMKIAALEDSEDALLFSSGMNTITTTLLTLLSSGDHLVMICPAYRRTREFTSYLERWGIQTSFVTSNCFDELSEALKPNTKVIFAETPSNPTLRVLDLPELTRLAEKAGSLTIVDSTFATPFNLQPLKHGVDLTIHSATKYLGGHNDLLAGAAAGSARLLRKIRDTRDVLGGVLGSFDAYLLQRGIKTLALRVQQQNQSGQKVAEFLETHPMIQRVHYPGLPSHPDHGIAVRLMHGFGGVVSFETKGTRENASAVIDHLRVPYIGPTLGGVESIAQQQALLLSDDPEERAQAGIPDQLIRYAVGIEDAADITADLDQALRAAFNKDTPK